MSLSVRVRPRSGIVGVVLAGALTVGAAAPGSVSAGSEPPSKEAAPTSANVIATTSSTSAPDTSDPASETTAPGSSAPSTAPTTAPTTPPSATTTAPTTSTTVPHTTTTAPPTGTTIAPTTTVAATTTTVPADECRPATTTTTTTTTTTLPGATTTTTTTTTTTPGSTTTSTTTTTVWLPECPTTTTSSTTTTTVAPAPTSPAPVDGPAPAPLGVPVPKELNDILVTIRLVESGNNYAIGKNRGGASGAYQYIDSTWNQYKGYPSAYLAPPWVQDERALMDVKAILQAWHGDVSMVPVIWYYPKAARNPELMDQVPLPEYGNRLTVRQYQLRWLGVLAQVSGEVYSNLAYLLPPELKDLSGRPPELAPPTDDTFEVAYPVLGRSVVAPPVACQRETCEPGTDAIVYGQKLQPVLAVADGVVTAVNRGDGISGGVSVTVTDVNGRTYRYSGFNDDSPGTDDGAGHPALGLSVLAQVGRTVRAGQVLGLMGDTDPMPLTERRGIDPDAPVWPHLRLQIRDADGNRLDADALVADAQNRQACHVGTGPWASEPDPRLLNPDDDELAVYAQTLADRGDDPSANPALTPDGYPRLEPVEVDALDNGGFRIAADGTVQAYGASALILHPMGCEWKPTNAFGPGASGAAAPEGFHEPIELPARYWVTGAATTLAQDGLGLPQVVYLTR